jgi:hypothetical protein
MTCVVVELAACFRRHLAWLRKSTRWQTLLQLLTHALSSTITMPLRRLGEIQAESAEISQELKRLEVEGERHQAA